MHRITTVNARTGTEYEIVLERVDHGWRATWRSSAGPSGSMHAGDDERAFRAARDAIERDDSDVIGVDWTFGEPLPPFISE